MPTGHLGESTTLWDTLRLVSARQAIAALYVRSASPLHFSAAWRGFSRLVESCLGSESLDAARAWVFLGKMLMENADPEAEDYFRRSLEIARRACPPNDPQITVMTTNLARICSLLGQQEEAEALYRESLAIDLSALGPDHPETLTDKNNLASFLSRRLGSTARQLAEARELLEEVIARDRVLPLDHENHVTNHINLGVLLDQEGDKAGAEHETRRALELSERFHPQQTLRLGGICGNLAQLVSARGRHAEAVEWAEKALAIDEEVLGPDHPDVGADLFSLAVLQLRLGKHEAALGSIRHALHLRSRLLGQVSAIASEGRRSAFLGHTLDELTFVLSLTRRLEDEGSAEIGRRARELATNLLLRRKALGLEALAAQRDALLEKRYPHARKTLRQLVEVKQQLARAMLAGADFGEQLAFWQEEKERLEIRLARAIPEMALARQLADVDWQTIIANAPPHAVLVELLRYRPFDLDDVSLAGQQKQRPAHYLAIVLQAGAEPRRVELGQAEAIDALLDQYLEAIRGPVDDRSFVRVDSGANEDAERILRDPKLQGEPPPDGLSEVATGYGNELRERVLDPVLEGLEGKRRLILAPDGELTRLPFGILPMGVGRVLDHFESSYVNTLRDILRFGLSPKIPVSSPLILADPDYDLAPEHMPPIGNGSDARRSRFVPDAPPLLGLPGTRIEGERVGQMLGARPFLGPEATKARLEACSSPSILHLASHAYFFPRKPPEATGTEGSAAGEQGGPAAPARHSDNPLLRCAIALAGANNFRHLKANPCPDIGNGLLTAEDASGLDLGGTDLVVLSACDTGLGEVRAGEGVFGLQRSFVLAGAATLVMSLWRVPDAETKMLMIHFYERLQADIPRHQALAEAQNAVRSEFPAPYYWGAFICQGDPGPPGEREKSHRHAAGGETAPSGEHLPTMEPEPIDSAHPSPAALHRPSFGVARFFGLLGFLGFGLPVLRGLRDSTALESSASTHIPVFIGCLFLGLLGSRVGWGFGLRIPVNSSRLARLLDSAYHYGANGVFVWSVSAWLAVRLALGRETLEASATAAGPSLVLLVIGSGVLGGWATLLILHSAFPALILKERVVAAGALLLAPIMLWTAIGAISFHSRNLSPVLGAGAGAIAAVVLVSWTERLVRRDRDHRMKAMGSMRHRASEGFSE